MSKTKKRPGEPKKLPPGDRYDPYGSRKKPPKKGT